MAPLSFPLHGETQRGCSRKKTYLECGVSIESVILAVDHCRTSEDFPVMKREKSTNAYAFACAYNVRAYPVCGLFLL